MKSDNRIRFRRVRSRRKGKWRLERKWKRERERESLSVSNTSCTYTMYINKTFFFVEEGRFLFELEYWTQFPRESQGRKKLPSEDEIYASKGQEEKKKSLILVHVKNTWKAHIG